jgi:hypothetical protein
MRAIKPLLVAGAAVAAMIGAAAVAASGPQAHVLIVRLPNGAVEQIRYFGDAPPKVVFTRAPVALEPFAPAAMFGPNSPFAQMDRQMAAVMAQAHAIQETALAGAAAPGGLQQVVVGQLPAGGESYSTISTFSGGTPAPKASRCWARAPARPPR